VLTAIRGCVWIFPAPPRPDNCYIRGHKGHQKGGVEQVGSYILNTSRCRAKTLIWIEGSHVESQSKTAEEEIEKKKQGCVDKEAVRIEKPNTRGLRVRPVSMTARLHWLPGLTNVTARVVDSFVKSLGSLSVFRPWTAGSSGCRGDRI
jgi:hypothetical protein